MAGAMRAAISISYCAARNLAEINASHLAEITESFRESTVPFLIEARDWVRLPESFQREIEREHVVLVAAVQAARPERKPRRSRPLPPISRSLGMEGNTRPFGELFAELTRNGLTRPRAVRGSGVKMVNMGELFAHPRLCNVPMDRVPLSQSESERFLLEDGDLLFARQSLVLEGAGKCSIFLRDDEPVTFESHVTRVRLDQKKAHPGYYFYYLQSHQGRSAIRSIVEQGAGASGIRASDLATLEVHWRPLPEQRAIAHILGTLDDKIELNRRMNETLEAIARALFKSWFVDFDPVRAKMAGRDTGLPQHLADLFPDRLVDSELGEIPEGWTVGTLGEICEVVDCLHSKKPGRTAEGKPLLQLWNIRDNGLTDMSDTYLIDEADYERWTSRIEVREGDCVITNVGRVGAVSQIPPGLNAALGRNMTAVRCVADFGYPTFVIAALLSDAMRWR